MYHVPSRTVMRLMHQHTTQEELETRTKRKNCERDTYNHSKRQKIRRCSSESPEEDIDEKVVDNRRIQVRISTYELSKKYNKLKYCSNLQCY